MMCFCLSTNFVEDRKWPEVGRGHEMKKDFLFNLEAQQMVEDEDLSMKM